MESTPRVMYRVPVENLRQSYIELYVMLLSPDAPVCKNTFGIVFSDCMDEFIYTNGAHYARCRRKSAETYLREHMEMPSEGEVVTQMTYYDRMCEAKKLLIKHYLI